MPEIKLSGKTKEDGPFIRSDIRISEIIPCSGISAKDIYNRLYLDQRNVPIESIKEEEEETPAKSFGFGLNKSKKEDETNKNKNEKDETERSILDIEQSVGDLNSTLSDWFGYQHQQQCLRSLPSVYVGIGSIGLDQKNRVIRPLLLVPARLVLADTEVRFKLAHAPFDYLYNPAVPKLLNGSDLDVPLLPDIREDLNIEHFFDDLTDALISQDGWSVQQKVYLCEIDHTVRFSFSSENELTEEVTVEEAEVNRKAYARIFRTVNPLAFHLNNEQFNILNTILQDKDVHVTGPYTSGQTQLAATALALDAFKEKSTLVLSNGNQELDKLYRRLQSALLHNCILKFHDSNSRASFLQSVTDTMDTDWTIEPIDNEEESHTANQAYNQINEYDQALNAPYGRLRMSPAELIDQLARMKDTPEIPVSIQESEEISADILDMWMEHCVSYQELQKNIENSEGQPWADTRITECSNDTKVEIKESLETLVKLKEDIVDINLDISEQVGLKAPSNPSEIEDYINHIHFFDEAPPLELAQLNTDWNPIPDEAKKLINLVEKGQSYLSSMKKYFHEGILQEHLIELVPRLKKKSISFTRFFDFRYRKDIKRLMQYAYDDVKNNKLAFWEHMKNAVAVQRIRRKLNDRRDTAQEYFGTYWNGLDTNTSQLGKQISWLQDLSHYMEDHNLQLTQQTKKYIASSETVPEHLFDDLRDYASRFMKELERLDDLLLLKDDSNLKQAERSTWLALGNELKAKKAAMDNLDEWLEYKEIDDSFSRPDIQELLKKVKRDQDIDIKEQLPDIIQKAVYSSLLQSVIAQRKKLQQINSQNLQDALEQVHRWFMENTDVARQKIINKLSKLRHKLFADDEVEQGLQIIQHELKKHSRHQPVDKLLERSADTLVQHAPLWFARYEQLEQLDEHLDKFDTVYLIKPNDDQLAQLLTQLTDQQLVILERDGVVDPTSKEAVSERDFQQYALTSLQQPMPRFLTPEISTIEVPDASYKQGSVPFQLIDALADASDNSDTQWCVTLQNRVHQSAFWQQYTKSASGEKQLRQHMEQATPSPMVLANQKLLNNSTALNHVDLCYGSQSSPESSGGNPFTLKKQGSAASSGKLSLEPKRMVQQTTGSITVLQRKNETDTSKKQFVNQLKSLTTTSDPDDHKLAVDLQKHVGDEWSVTGHPDNPFEATVKHTEHTSLTYYVWVDAVQLLPEGNLIDHYRTIKQADYEPVHFPVLYYPDRIHEWFISFKQQLDEDLEEYEQRLQEEQEMQEVKAKAAEFDKEKKIEAKQKQALEQPVEEAPKSDIDKLLAEFELPDSLTFEPVSSQQETAQPAYDAIPSGKPYKLHEGITLGTKMDFFDASDKKIQKIILDVVDVESPIHWRNLMRCIAAYWQIQRVNQNVEAAVKRNIKKLHEQERVFIKDGCLYDNPKFNFKLRDRSDTIEFHRADEVPLDECEAAVFSVLEKQYPLKLEDLLELTALTLGFPRLDHILEHQLSKAITRMAQQKTLVKGDNGIQLKPQFYSKMKM